MATNQRLVPTMLASKRISLICSAAETSTSLASIARRLSPVLLSNASRPSCFESNCVPASSGMTRRSSALSQSMKGLPSAGSVGWLAATLQARKQH